jgi:uncharacterized protein (DUF2062 family)
MAPLEPSRLVRSAPQQPRKTWRTRLRQRLLWLWHHEGSHGQRARGLAAGVFMGCFPIFGLQTLFGIALASVVRGNHILAAAGTWISNPFTYVPLYWFNYAVGCQLLGPGPALPTLQQIQRVGIWDLGLAMTSRLMLGSALVGLVASLLLGGIYWWLLERHHRRSAHV